MRAEPSREDREKALEWAGDRSEDQLDFEAKRDHGGSAFWTFAIVSPVLFWLSKVKPTGWTILVYVSIGMFTIPVASILTFLLKMKLAARLTPSQAISLQVPWFIFDTSYSIVTTWLLFMLLAKF